MITIYDINGNPKISVPISDKCVYYKGVMEEEYVRLGNFANSFAFLDNMLNCFTSIILQIYTLFFK